MCSRYRNELVLSDSTIGYHLERVSKLHFTRPFCGLIKHMLPYYVHLQSCNLAVYAAIVCEFKATERQTNEMDRKLTIASLTNQTQWDRNALFSSLPETIMCPRGHVVHTFLACDLTSACWHEDSETGSHFTSGGGECLAPLNPLPPLYACMGKGQYVPYTLVCDHRSDCFDDSDEDFCVFHKGDNLHDGFTCTMDRTAQCGRTHEVLAVSIIIVHKALFWIRKWLCCCCCC